MDKQKIMGIVAGGTIVLALVVFLATRGCGGGGDAGGGGGVRGENLPEVVNESALARPTDVHAIVAAVKDKGEQHVVKIAVAGPEACEVTVADGSREGKTGRKYKVTKKGGAWEVGEKTTWGK
jgi:hypothetical protein